MSSSIFYVIQESGVHNDSKILRTRDLLRKSADSRGTPLTPTLWRHITTRKQKEKERQISFKGVHPHSVPLEALRDNYDCMKLGFSGWRQHVAVAKFKQPCWALTLSPLFLLTETTIPMTNKRALNTYSRQLCYWSFFQNCKNSGLA